MPTQQAHNADAVQVSAWRRRFDALVRDRMNRPFAWGTHDCCMWAADCVLAITGTDPAAAYRGSYSTEAEAMALLDSLGGLEAIGAMAGPACPALTARIGDIGIVSGSGAQTLGVCIGTGWLAPAAAGLAHLPLTSARRAWRVSHG